MIKFLTLGLLAIATSGLSGVASAQQHSILLGRGHPVPGYGTVWVIDDVAIAEDGSYYARVRTDNGTGVLWDLILKDGDLFQVVGDTVANGPATIHRFGYMTTDTRGGLVSIPQLVVPGGLQPRLGLMRNQDLVLAPGAPLGIAGASASSTYEQVNAVHSVEPDRFLVASKFGTPLLVPADRRALVEVRTDALGNVSSEELIFQELDLFPGTTRQLFAVPGWSHQFAGNSNGDVLAVVGLSPPTGSSLWTLVLNDEILIDGGAPSPIAGHVWQVPYLHSIDLNEAADWVAHAYLDDGTSETSCIVKNGEVLCREGQVFPGTAPHGLNSFEPGEYLKLTDEGDVIWIGSWGLRGNTMKGVFFNDQLVMAPNSSIGVGTFYSPWAVGAAADGSRQATMVFMQLANGGVGNFLVETRWDMATTFCDAVPNSTGRAANTAVMGSPVAADNNITLRATNLPEGAFTLLLTSPVQAFVPQPGGSVGNLCLGGSIGRYVAPGQLLQAGPEGRVELAVDLTQHPTPLGSVAVGAGETWLFQAWYRDSLQGQPVSNFTDAAAVRFE